MSPEENQQHFSIWLRGEMEKHHWSQADLAHAAHLSRAVICKLIAGKVCPEPTTLNALAHAFKLPAVSVYRASKLLPEIPPAETFLDEASHLLLQIRNPQRRTTALHLIRALAEEESGQHSETV